MGDQELETLGMIGASYIHAIASDRADVCKYPRSISEIVKFGYRKWHVSQPQPGLAEGDSHETVGFGKRKRAQQNRIHDAENRGVGADAEGERDNGDSS